MKLKPLFVIGFLIACCATLVGIAVVFINVRGRSAWEAYVADARTRGIKMTLQEFLPAPVPDAENFARVPLFADLFSEDEAVRTEALKKLTIPRPEDSKSSGAQPTLTDLASWQAAFVKAGDLPAATADPAADVLSGIARHCGPALAELAEAERRPYAVFPVKWEMGFAALLPHMSMIKNAARIHKLRLAAHLAKKDTAAAYEELRGLLRLYRALEKEPTLIAGLVRISVLSIAASGVWEGVVQGSWSADDLAAIQQDLAKFDLLADCQFAMATERGGMNYILDKLRNGELPVAETENIAAAGNNGPEQVMLRAAPHFSGWVAFNQLAINRHHDRFVPRINVATATVENSGANDTGLESMKESLPKRYFYALALLTIPALGSVEKNYLHAHTTLQLTRLACALERCRLGEGTYPETLAALVPKYIEALPHDVIDGQPLRYRRTDDGQFVLYSIAMNAKDDGGKTGDANSDRDRLDWAWRWPEKVQ